MLKTKKIVFLCLFIPPLLLLVIVYGSLNPENSHLFPKCPFRLITSYDCPGCGSQRAMHYLLNLNISDAFQANALLVISIPYILFLLFAELMKSKGKHYLLIHKILYGEKAIWIAFFIIMAWSLGRNL
jgi:hypothetical protein